MPGSPTHTHSFIRQSLQHPTSVRRDMTSLKLWAAVLLGLLAPCLSDLCDSCKMSSDCPSKEACFGGKCAPGLDGMLCHAAKDCIAGKCETPVGDREDGKVCGGRFSPAPCSPGFFEKHRLCAPNFAFPCETKSDCLPGLECYKAPSALQIPPVQKVCRCPCAKDPDCQKSSEDIDEDKGTQDKKVVATKDGPELESSMEPSEDASPEPKPTRSANGSNGSSGVCVDATFVEEIGCALVHLEHIFSDVLCHQGLPCMTPGHAVRVQGRLVAIEDFCASSDSRCTSRKMNVNSCMTHLYEEGGPAFGDVTVTMYNAKYPELTQRVLHRALSLVRGAAAKMRPVLTHASTFQTC